MAEQSEQTSLTFSTSDAAVAYCLGALHLWAVRPADRVEGRHQDFVEWTPARRSVTLAFPSEGTERKFLAKAQELLPADSWTWSKLVD